MQIQYNWKQKDSSIPSTDKSTIFLAFNAWINPKNPRGNRKIIFTYQAFSWNLHICFAFYHYHGHTYYVNPFLNKILPYSHSSYDAAPFRYHFLNHLWNASSHSGDPPCHILKVMKEPSKLV